MAISMNGSGVITPETTNRQTFNSVASYSFCSAILTSTAAYTANQITFGAKLQEIHITNLGSNAIAFQFEEFFGTTKDSGIVLGGQTVVIRKVLKGGIAIRSADTVLASTAVIFGV